MPEFTTNDSLVQHYSDEVRMTRFGQLLAKVALFALFAFAGGLVGSGCTTATKKAGDATSTNDMVVVVDTNVEPDTGPDLSSEDVNQGRDGSKLPFGSQCDSNKQCESNLCVPADVATGGAVYVCSKNCLEECPNDWQCKVIVLGADTLTVCLPANANLCDISKQCEWKDSEGTITEDSEPCGNCGVRKRSCQANCQYGPWGTCEGEKACKFGASEERSCGKCGTQVRVCTAECSWSSWSPCSNEKSCLPGEKDTKSCGNQCGEQERVCLSTCEWSDYGICQNSGVCIPGTKDSELCTTVDPYFSQCRKRTRTCTDSCTWDAYGICEKSGVCEKGDHHPDSPREPDPKNPDEVNCWRKCGKMVRKCNDVICGWDEWECEEPVPTGDECLRTGNTDPNKHNYKSEDCGTSCGKKTFWCAEFDGVNDKTKQPFQACNWTLRPEVDPDKACIESTASCSLTPTPEQETENCGLCMQGKRFRVCGEGTGTCAWGNWSTCSYELAEYKKACTQNGEDNCYCQPGEQESVSCGKCGKKFRQCGNDCKWGTFSSCQNQGVCQSGDKETRGGPKCLSEERICTNTCKWGGWTTKYQGVCEKGTKQKELCGSCGWKSRTCGSTCQWGGYGSCDYGDWTCKPGTSQSCTLCGTKQCSNSCNWGSCGSEINAIDAYDGGGGANNSKANATYFGSFSDSNDDWHNRYATLVPAYDIDYYRVHFSDDWNGIIDVKIRLYKPNGAVSHLMNVEAVCSKKNKGRVVKTCNSVTACNISPDCDGPWYDPDDSINVYIRVFANGSPHGSCSQYRIAWTQ